MPLTTTVVGSMPKPSFLFVPAWVENGKEVTNFVEKYNEMLERRPKEELEQKLLEAFKEVVKVQEEAGVDVITDGELAREKYIYSFCRQLNGFDFHNLNLKTCRNGAWTGKLPCIVSAVSPKLPRPWLETEWRNVQHLTNKKVKATIPGPMTIIDSVTNTFYEDEEELSQVLVKCINKEIKALGEAGCINIQVCLLKFGV